MNPAELKTRGETFSLDSFDPTQKSGLGSPLLAACQDKNLKLGIKLIDAGANVNIRDVDGSTPLHRAVEGVAQKGPGEPDLLRHLLKNGAMPNARNNRGETPIMTCLQAWPGTFFEWGTKGSQNPFNHFIEILIESGADLALKDMRGQTVAMIAAAKHNHFSLMNLIGRGAKVNEQDNQGNNVMHYAAGHLKWLVKTAKDSLSTQGGY